MDRLCSARAWMVAAVAAFAPTIAVAALASPGAPQVVVHACVSGGTLTDASAAPGDASGRAFATRYRIAGRKALVKGIKKDHAGHVDEFTGTISGDLAATGLGPSVDLGKLSVRVGGAGPNSAPNAARVPETPVFEVTSFRHTDAKCAP